MAANPKLELVVKDALELDYSGYSWAMAKDAIEQSQAGASVDTHETVLALVVKHVPKSWLVADAPKDIDWHNAESFDYLQSPKMSKLIEQMQNAHELYPAKPAPVFTFERLSYGDEKKLASILTGLQDRMESDPSAMLELFNQQERLFAKTVIDIPQGWLVADAPKDLNWRDPASYGYLQQPAFRRLQEEFKAAKEDAAKN